MLFILSFPGNHFSPRVLGWGQIANLFIMLFLFFALACEDFHYQQHIFLWRSGNSYFLHWNMISLSQISCADNQIQIVNMSSMKIVKSISGIKVCLCFMLIIFRFGFITLEREFGNRQIIAWWSESQYIRLQSFNFFSNIFVRLKLICVISNHLSWSCLIRYVLARSVQLPFSFPRVYGELYSGFAFDHAAGFVALRTEAFCVQLFSLFYDAEISQVSNIFTCLSMNIWWVLLQFSLFGLACKKINSLNSLVNLCFFTGSSMWKELSTCRWYHCMLSITPLFTFSKLIFSAHSLLLFQTFLTCKRHFNSLCMRFLLSVLLRCWCYALCRSWHMSWSG